MMTPIRYNGDVLNHNARVGVDGGIVESLDFAADFSEQTKRVNMPLLLDIYPNAAAAYSLRKLRTAYTGAAIRVRRSSDNTETDIGFNNAGDLDVSALTAFVGNNNGFVTTWYDQSGNSNNATSTGTTQQPVIFSGGTIISENNRPSLRFDGVNTYLNSNNVASYFTGIDKFLTASTVLKGNQSTPSSNQAAWGFANSSTDTPIRWFGQSSGTTQMRLDERDDLTVITNTIGGDLFKNSLGFLISNADSKSLFSNSVNVDSDTGTFNQITLNKFSIGCLDRTSRIIFFNGQLQEIIFWPSNQSTNRIGIETNINSYYRIYQQEALLLDYYPDAAAAYSLRKLRAGYTGAAIQVRRSSDSAVQNIGFDSNGGLDVTALTSFVGTGNTGFVTTWYDQSGNNRNATQTGTTAQPVIFSGGTVINENNRPSLRFDGANNFLRTNYQPNLGITSNIKYSLTAVSRPLSAHQGRIWSSQSITSGLPVVYFRYETTFFRGFTRDSDLVGLAVTGGTFIQRQTNFTTIVDNNVSYLYVNKENITQSSVIFTGSLSLADPFEIGRLSSGVDWLHATLQEIIFYPSNQSTNRQFIEANINSYYNIYPTDSDANAFVTAAGLTDTTQIQAVNKLVTDLKRYDLWGKMKAIYPFVGGTANAHKFNLKDPRDVDGAFRLVFSGGWTHSATGALPNGTTGWAETYANPSLLFNNSVFNHLSYYSRTNSAVAFEYVMGVAVSNSGATSLIIRRDTNLRLFAATYTNAIYFGASDNNSTDGRGYFIGTQQGNNVKLFRNASLQASNTNLSSGLGIVPNSIAIGALKLDGVVNMFHTNKECAFATIGDGLTDTEAANLYTAVQAFQTTLGRQV